MITVDELKKIFNVIEDQELAPIFNRGKGAISVWRKSGVPPTIELKARELTKSTLINGNNHHIDFHISANESSPEYGNPLTQIFLADWNQLSDVDKMRVWTIVKEKLEEKKRGDNNS